MIIFVPNMLTVRRTALREREKNINLVNSDPVDNFPFNIFYQPRLLWSQNNLMTPELKQACELVFQEHKTAGAPITWHKDSFRGQLSFGMAALAKQTLERKNIINTIPKAKKTMTVLNPLALTAYSFEEAEEQVRSNTPMLVLEEKEEQPIYDTATLFDFPEDSMEDTVHLLKVSGTSLQRPPKTQWWMKPVFYYFLWPVFGALVGVIITYLLGLLV